MGYSFDAGLYDVEKLRKRISSEKKRGELRKLDEILSCFGVVKDGKFLLQNVESWDEYNSYFQVMNFIERYYGIEKSYEVFSLYDNDALLMKVDSGANADEVADEIGVKLSKDPDEEDAE